MAADIALYALTEEQMQYADDIFEKETGRSRLGSGSFLTTGWFSMILMKEICGEIHIYGIVDDGYCTKLAKGADAPYHYYNPDGIKECKMMVGHEHAKAAAHRYMTEKKVFRKWAIEHGNWHFHAPEWQ